MRNGQADQSVFCADGEHDDCPHMVGLLKRLYGIGRPAR